MHGPEARLGVGVGWGVYFKLKDASFSSISKWETAAAAPAKVLLSWDQHGGGKEMLDIIPGMQRF